MGLRENEIVDKVYKPYIKTW